MGGERVWTTTKDGNVHIIPFTTKYIKEAFKAMATSFLKDEIVCSSIGVTDDPEAVTEVLNMCEIIAKDGTSLLAIEKATGRVVGVSINKIQTKDGADSQFYEDYLLKCKRPGSRAMLEFIIETEDKCDLFEESQTDCIMEMGFMTTIPEFRGRGIAIALAEAALDLLKCLNKGENVKVGPDNETIPLQPVPKGLSGLFTSQFTQKMAQHLQFTKAGDWLFRQSALGSLIDPKYTNYTLEYKLVTN